MALQNVTSIIAGGVVQPTVGAFVKLVVTFIWTIFSIVVCSTESANLVSTIHCTTVPQMTKLLAFVTLSYVHSVSDATPGKVDEDLKLKQFNDVINFYIDFDNSKTRSFATRILFNEQNFKNFIFLYKVA